MRRERPDWPADQPLAVVAKVKSAMRVLAADGTAQGAGVVAGLTLKDARARAPHLLTAPFDAAADARLWRGLLTACRRFTPSLTDPAPDALVLDVSGAEGLFGSDAALLARVAAVFAREGVALRPGLADTPGLAWALARFAHDPVAPPGGSAPALQPLPVEALGLTPEDVADLRGLGFRCVGEVMARPRALLAEALEGRLGERLDELLGFRACPLTLRLEPDRIGVDRPLLHAISGADAVLHHVRRMAEGVERQLERRGLGGRVFRLTLFGARGLQRRLEVRARTPLARPAEITALFARRFEGAAEVEGVGEDEAFDQLRLEARLTEPQHALTADLWDDHEGEARFEAFVASLSARFGREAVEVIVTDTRTALPEREARFAPLGACKIGDGPAAPLPVFGDAILRPLRLFDRPQPIQVLAGLPDDPPATIVWRRVHRRILKAEGPERLAAEGARGGGGLTRDYYRVEDSQGRRYWVFRDGLFSEAAAPRWYLHGLFA